ncbi:histidine kinase, partial [bacterium]|nr:histidine kinase [bacterium]
KPELVIKGTSVFFEPMGERNLNHLSNDENHLTFNYVGLWYQNPLAVTYRYKLTGVTHEWIYLSDRSITFPNLSPGKYTFEVQATAGSWNESQVSSSSVSFGIMHPFWGKWWFILGAVAAVLGLILFIIKTREDRLKAKERLETEKIEFQFETLKSQINPHFLFNSLNTLVTVIEEDKEEAVDYVEKLSDFYRSMLEYRSHNLIAIPEELRMLKDYFFLQKKRFGDNLNLHIEVDEKNIKGNIAPLTLQMLVENAIKHNVISRKKPMTISVTHELGYIKVSNLIQAKRNQEPSTRVGLQNISNRYALLTSKEVLVEATDIFFTVSIPILS